MPPVREDRALRQGKQRPSPWPGRLLACCTLMRTSLRSLAFLILCLAGVEIPAWSMAVSSPAPKSAGVVAEYGYRYYVAELGRWPNRDPLGEKGGVNLYGLLTNSALNHADFLGMEDFRSSLVAAAVKRTQDKFSTSALARTTGILAATSKLAPLTGYDVQIDASLPAGVAGEYSRWRKTIYFPGSPTDAVVLHELVHVYNHQITGIGGLLANSRSLDEGMAYYLQIIYQASDALRTFESGLRRSGTCTKKLVLASAAWPQFWDTYGKQPNYPLDKIVPTIAGNWTLPINFIDELAVRRHLGAGLKCGDMVAILNPLVSNCCIKFSCAASGPLEDASGVRIIYSGVKLPFYQR